LVGHLVVRKEQ
jgi:hypothetical protein